VEKEMNRLKIPETDSIEELAKFWDAHDLTDFEEQLEEVTEPLFERGMETFSVSLQPQEIESVKRIAKFKGIGHATLIRGWILEKLCAS
jgi:predicted DNA binding CopG/RHH family protein